MSITCGLCLCDREQWLLDEALQWNISSLIEGASKVRFAVRKKEKQSDIYPQSVSISSAISKSFYGIGVDRVTLEGKWYSSNIGTIAVSRGNVKGRWCECGGRKGGLLNYRKIDGHVKSIRYYI